MTVYVVVADASDGVPVMSPDDVLKSNPIGRAGVTAYEVGVPPDMVGELVLISTFTE